ncbi:MAG: hypothetical protein K2Y29_13335 [Beijerinckiaceae bacterium]|nr:hypothetical protein [Beijerinckiaceae bacterium]
MRKRSFSPEQNVRPGTEYARSIAGYAPQDRPPAMASLLSHPMAPAVALALFAAGVALLWPRQAHGEVGRNAGRRVLHDGDAEYAGFPPRRR